MPEISVAEQDPVKEEIIKVISDFEDENGKHPEIQVNKNAPAAFLFDIDGTLVDIRPIHGATLVARYQECVPEDLRFNDPKFQQEFSEAFYLTFGKGLRHPQQDILREQFGIQASEEQLDQVIEGYAAKLEEELGKIPKQDRKNYILPGAVEFVENVKRGKWPAGIVTGNTEASAKAILKTFGWSEYFITGGYSEDVPPEAGVSDKRAVILEASLGKLAKKGLGYSKNQSVVAGDTPSDFKATLRNGEKTGVVLLVSTGDFSTAELDLAGAHLVLPSLHLTGDPEKDEELIKRITQRA